MSEPVHVGDVISARDHAGQGYVGEVVHIAPPMGTMGDQALIRFSIDGTDFNVRTVQVALDGCRVLRRAKCTI